MFKLFPIGIVIFALVGCASSPQKTPEQEKETLVVYPDNRVGFIINQRHEKRTYSYHDNPNEVLAYRFFDGTYRYLNAVDIATITGPKDHGGRVTLKTTNGNEYRALPRSLQLYRCDPKKSCVEEIGGRHGSIKIKAVYGDENFYPIYESFSKDYFLPNTSTGHEVIIQSGEAYAKMLEKLNAGIQQAQQLRNQKLSLEDGIKARHTAVIAERKLFLEQEASKMRASVKIGTRTNCGQVFDVRLPMVGVQTIAGMQFIELKRLYGPSADCQFVNGQYVGVTSP